jgi:gamma-glutamyltranspeptidase/glutathione hydrolase
MLSQDYAKLVSRQVLKRVKSHGETTHLSVMDQEGNAVALTQSIERVYGSYSATAELGFLYNNYMSAFEYEDMAHPYFMRPNAAPWASVAPTLVFRGRRPWLAIGSPGSERITPSILQVLIRLQTCAPLAAVDAPRLHCSLDGKVSLEATRMRSDIPEALKRHGLQVDMRDPYSFYLGCVQLVMRERNEFIGVADPRRDGAAGGPARKAKTRFSSTAAKAARKANMRTARAGKTN